MKQEQLPAEDEAVEVAPGVVRVQLPIMLPGLGHVNCYVLEDDRGVTLVDPGLPDPDSHRELRTRLARIGVPLERVHTVVVTHSHPDHFGGAGRLHAEHRCDVVAHEDFQTLFDRSDILQDVLFGDVSADDLPGRDTPWGGEALRLTALELDHMRSWDELSKQGLLELAPTTRVAGGQLVPLGSGEWLVVHTPGHTADHICLFDPEHGTLLSGDHVLPTITPHISGLGMIDDPLEEFFTALKTVAAIDGVNTVLPAHGLPFDDVSLRVGEIIEHHQGRLDRLNEIADELGDGTVTDYAHHLFRERSWGPMADSETFAHLEHLRHQGTLRSIDGGPGQMRFAPVG